MIKIRTDGEKFSAECAYRVLGVLARNKKCTIKDACAECGISKMTGGRVFRLLEREGLIRKYPYHPFSGRGARPTYYVLNPKSIAAVLDLREGVESFALLFPPRYRKITVEPRIASSKDISQKNSMLIERFPHLSETLTPEKYLLSLSVITGDADPVREIVPPDSFFFTPRELEALWAMERFPGQTVLLILTDPSGADLSLCRDGEPVAYRSSGADEDEIAGAAASVCTEYSPEAIRIVSSDLTALGRERLHHALRSAGIGDEIPVSFSDGAEFDLQTVAAKASIDALTLGDTYKTKVVTQ
ncbi:MAG: MarR family transcriptional regulator [Clostridia bacterium]|nr:MarR family transcriptional regulator [Clostridia bacterium]